MNFSAAARIARRELRGGVAGFRIFLLCLMLGVAAIAAVGTVREAVEAGLRDQGAVMLGGDASVETNFRYATADERAWMDSVATRVSEVVDFRSMAVVGDGSSAERALTQVKGVDDAYPLTGNVQVSPSMPLAQALAGADGLPGAVMQRVLIDRLGLKVGDSFRLGTKAFRLMAELVVEPDATSAGFSFGPRTIVRAADLDGSALLGQGTIFDAIYRLNLPEEANLNAVERDMRTRFAGSDLHWRDRRNGAPGVMAFVDRLSSFLVLVGLAGLAVGGVGVSASVRAYLARKTEVIATLRTLGADRGTVLAVYLIQIGILAVIGITAGVVLGCALPRVFAPLIEARLPVPVDFAFHPRPPVEAALYGGLTALVFVLWPLARAGEIRPAALFREESTGASGLPGRRWLMLIGALALALVALAAFLSRDALLVLWTAGGVVAALAILAAAALGLRRLARRLARMPKVRGRPALRLALAAIGGAGEGTGAVMMSLGLGLTVLAAVGQIDVNLRDAIDRDLPKMAPSYFFVDIQPDQIDGFRARLDGDPGVHRVDAAPMLRGMITQINGRSAREVADHWVLRGDRGVTYADEKPATWEITEGAWWPKGYDGPPQVSFAAEEAKEIGLKLGDRITVNILGRDIEAEITSFRVVDFSSAGIGFVLAMNPSALAGAPHTWIATVYADPEAEAPILRDLASAYPNITAIRVKDAIDNVAQVLDGVAAASSWAAGVTLLTGFVVLVGAAAAGERARVYEAAVLKTLGATRARILASFALRSAIMGAAAGAVAIAAGVLAGWAVMRFVMHASFAVAWGPAIGIVAGGIIAVLAAGLAFVWQPLAVRPARILRAMD
ncbi:MAG: FtsX-like permease family protein [Rhodobacteraceae bacterium]|nr:FtsX-like permease family protein [Paracoccaceae bacterium]